MTIDFWGIGLQAINVLILIWLLSWLFWRPVADAIARRQEDSRKTINDAAATKAQADAALADVTQAREGIDAERAATLEAARAEAEIATKATMTEARAKADALLAAAKTSIGQDAEVARKENAAQASDLSLDIAARLLKRLNSPTVQAAFTTDLVTAIAKIPTAKRAALADSTDPIQIVTAIDMGDDHETVQAAILKALGGAPLLEFVTDPDLIGGIELRGAHFALRNSWQADLIQIRKAVKDAA